MTDREPKYPGRVKLTDVETGFEKVYDMTMADEPLDPGTPPTKPYLFSDETASLYPKGTGTVNDALAENCTQIGDIKFTVRDNLGSGYLPCDGSSVDGEDYPELKSSGAYNEVDGVWPEANMKFPYEATALYVVNGVPCVVRGYSSSAQRFFYHYDRETKTWVESNNFSLTNSHRGLAYGNGKYIIVFYNEKLLYYSSDLVNWTLVNNSYINCNRGIAFLDGNFIVGPTDGSRGNFLSFSDPAGTIDYSTAWSAGDALGSMDRYLGVFNNRLFFTAMKSGTSAGYYIWSIGSVGGTATLHDGIPEVGSSYTSMAYANGVYLVCYSPGSSSFGFVYASKDLTNWYDIGYTPSYSGGSIIACDGRFFFVDANKSDELIVADDLQSVTTVTVAENKSQYVAADENYIVSRKPDSPVVCLADAKKLVLPNIPIDGATAYIRVK